MTGGSSRKAAKFAKIKRIPQKDFSRSLWFLYPGFSLRPSRLCVRNGFYGSGLMDGDQIAKKTPDSPAIDKALRKMEGED